MLLPTYDSYGRRILSDKRLVHKAAQLAANGVSIAWRQLSE